MNELSFHLLILHLAIFHSTCVCVLCMNLMKNNAFLKDSPESSQKLNMYYLNFQCQLGEGQIFSFD